MTFKEYIKQEGVTGQETKLDANRVGLTDINGIEKFVNLKKLSLGHNQITDLSPLSSLTGLTDLDLENNQIVYADMNNKEFADIVYHAYSKGRLKGNPFSSSFYAEISQRILGECEE